MIFQGRCNIRKIKWPALRKNPRQNNGLILVDIILAMSLAVLFVLLITQLSADSRDIFEFSKERSRLFDLFEAHAGEFEGMRPYESREIIINADRWKYSTTTMRAYAHWYGNDRIQTDIAVSDATTSLYTRIPSLTFNIIHSYPYPDIDDAAGTPLCSVDFSNKNIVGSYQFQNLYSTLTPTSNSSDQSRLPPNPQYLVTSITSIVLPIDPSLPLTDFEMRNGIAYVSADSPKASDMDFLIFDIRDPENPFLLSSINTGPGIASIALARDRVFAAAASTAAQLHIIRINSLNFLTLEKKFQLPPPYATVTPPMGSSIFYNKNKIYLGTEKWDGDEFNIIDVSNTMNPKKIGSLKTGSKISDIFVRDGIAYIADSDEKQLRKVDITDPTTPLLLDSFNPSGWERQEGKILSFFEDALALGRTSGGFNIKQDYELFTLGTSSIAVPNHSVDISGGVYGIVADRSYIFVATRQLDHEIQIFDHDPSTTTMKAISLPVAPQTLSCDGNSLYVLAATAPVIYKISFK